VRRGSLVLPLLLVGLLVVPGWSSAALPPAPAPVPIDTWGRFLTGLAVPTLAPGASGVIDFSVQDPLGVPMSRVVLALEFYAFNAYPGNATGPVPLPAPLFSIPGVATNGPIPIVVGNLTPDGTSFTSPGAVSVVITVPDGAPQGTYALRTSLTFLAGGLDYVLESRGYFSAAEWENATAPPGSPSTLNVTRLGVAGVIPETALLVRSNPFPVALSVVLGGAVVLAAVGGYWAVRRGPWSNSGAKAGPPPNQAETAFGKRRSNDGD
jgi:hypothetical protein